MIRKINLNLLAAVSAYRDCCRWQLLAFPPFIFIGFDFKLTVCSHHLFFFQNNYKNFVFLLSKKLSFIICIPLRTNNEKVFQRWWIVMEIRAGSLRILFKKASVPDFPPLLLCIDIVKPKMLKEHISFKGNCLKSCSLQVCFWFLMHVFENTDFKITASDCA